jgi:hypothetical protein
MYPAAMVAPVAGVGRDGSPYLDLPGTGIVSARTTSTVSQLFSDGLVPPQTPALLVFENGDPHRAIIIGLLGPVLKSAEAEVDGKKLTLTGEEEVTLRCGKASITLTKAGKVLITGDYLLSRSRGVNRIKGGSVQIN